VNTGVAKVELGVTVKDTLLRKTELREAISELDGAIQCAAAMKTMAAPDASAKGHSDDTEATLHILQATQLESLALRWRGAALWQQFRRNESFQSFFETAASIDSVSSLPSTLLHDYEIFDAVLDCRKEAYYGWSTLAELATRSLEHAKVSAVKESPRLFEEMLDFATKALQNASSCSESIRKLLRSAPAGGSHGDLLQDSDIMTSEQLLQSLKEIQEWWQERKKSIQKHIIDSSKDSAAMSVPRSDVLPEGFLDNKAPTRRFIFKEGSRRRKQKRTGGAGYSNIGPSTSTPPREQAPTQTKKFRKWGDGLLPQTVDENGRSVPKLVYPAIAPEMPPEIAAILARRQHNLKS
jgi:hypothetical protein